MDREEVGATARGLATMQLLQRSEFYRRDAASYRVAAAQAVEIADDQRMAAAVRWDAISYARRLYRKARAAERALGCRCRSGGTCAACTVRS